MRPVSLSGLVVLAILAVAALAASAGQPRRITIRRPQGSGPIGFAAQEIRLALEAIGLPVVEGTPQAASGPAGGGEVAIMLAAGTHPPAGGASVAAELLPPQGFTIRTIPEGIWEVRGGDEVGAMYGGLELAERIRLDKGLRPLTEPISRSPAIARRGLKFNIPLDLRTPSYSDCSDAAQRNIPEMWSMDFWREFLDDMARHRFNVLTLWSLHPFPSLVRVPEYPDVALDDVWRTKAPLDDTFSHSGNDMVRPAMLADHEVVKRMTIDEKIRFWRDVMDYAHDRGIEVYWFTWNMFVFGAEGKHGITSAQDNPVTIDYFRKSVRQLVLTYPRLAGIGITAGERLQDRKDEFAKEKWLWKAYGEGIRDALREQPTRQVRLIHRFHQTSFDQVEREWKDYPGPFDFSFKYAIAHMYGIPRPPFIDPVLAHLSPRRRTWLTVRNDCIYSFRWGDPAFARQFIQAIPGPDKVAGFYMGPDGFTWGRDFLTKDAPAPRPTILAKQWYSFLLWGRLSYDPTIGDEHFRRIVAGRFPQVDGERLFAAWAEASKVFPLITRFFWGGTGIDLHWFPEACLSHPRHKGFYTVRHFIEGHTEPGSGILDILQWRQRKLAGRPGKDEQTPLTIADALDAAADAALRQLPRPAAAEEEKLARELRATLADIETMAALGRYYAAKIRGACELALFDQLQEEPRRQAAVKHLQAAHEHWQRYAELYARQYRQPVLYNRVGWVDLPKLAEKTAADIAIARDWKAGTLTAEPDRRVRRTADETFRK